MYEIFCEASFSMEPFSLAQKKRICLEVEKTDAVFSCFLTVGTVAESP